MTDNRSIKPGVQVSDLDNQDESLRGDKVPGRVGVYDRSEAGKRAPSLLIIILILALILIAVFLAIYVVPSLFFIGS